MCAPLERIDLMSRKFIATIVAASIAVTGFGAAPARADDDDVRRALAAILGLAVVGAIIHESKKDDHVVTRHKPRTVYNPPRPRHAHPKPRPRHAAPAPRHIQPKPLPRHIRPHHTNKLVLPAKCFRSYDTRRGTYRGFGKRCLNQSYRFVSSLPQRCLFTFRTAKGRANGYEARCLRNAGYRLARR